MRYCYLCGKKATPAGNVSLHKFPRKQETRQKWIKALGLHETDNVSHLNICSKHFNLPQNLVTQMKWRLPSEVVPELDNNKTVEVSPSKEVLQNPPAMEVPHVSTIGSTNVPKSSTEVQIVSAISETTGSEVMDLEIMNSEVMDSAVVDSEVMNSTAMYSEIQDDAVQLIVGDSTSHKCSDENVSTPPQRNAYVESLDILQRLILLM
jgi:hypothetical protein